MNTAQQMKDAVLAILQEEMQTWKSMGEHGRASAISWPLKKIEDLPVTAPAEQGYTLQPDALYPEFTSVKKEENEN